MIMEAGLCISGIVQCYVVKGIVHNIFQSKMKSIRKGQSGETNKNEIVDGLIKIY